LQAWSGEDGIAEMKRLFVRGDARGHGIGERLISEIIEQARRLGYRYLRLDSMADRMPAAIRLYRRFGFREIEAYRYNPQPDAAYLELEIQRWQSA
jgi:ribosomal protein S18 acetylase RimI-like enzyme